MRSPNSQLSLSASHKPLLQPIRQQRSHQHIQAHAFTLRALGERCV
jgi:hypothetical protein